MTARAQKIIGAVVTVCFAALVFYGAVIHEPWWDEAQAWLIARDATMTDLFTERLAYEGHPPLWYLLLAIPAKAGLPYKSMHVVAGLIAIAGVALLQRQRNVPLLIRILLPFTFYFAYQFTVVARSYVVLGALLIAVAAIYDRRSERFWLFVAILLAMANVSIHGTGIASALALLFLFDEWRARRKGQRAVPLSRLFLAGALFVIDIAFLAIVMAPPADISGRFNMHHAFRIWKLWSVPSNAYIETLFGYDWFFTILASQLAFIFLLFWFWRTRTLGLFALMVISIVLPCAVYYSPWHEGVFFFILMTALLVSYSRPVAHRRLRHAVTIVFALVLARHIYWTASSYAYDATSAMTGSGAAAKYIREHHLDRTRLYGAGVRCIEVQPYFASNVFGNQRTQGGASFWDFSERNPWPYPGWLDRERTRWMNLQLAQRPDYMLVATGFGGDIFFSAMMSRRTDYRRIQVFRGRLLWKTTPIESIMFHLYERVDSKS
jgi:hypothetical protein